MISNSNIEKFVSEKLESNWQIQGDHVDSSGRRKAHIFHSEGDKSIFVKYSEGENAFDKMMREQQSLELFDSIEGVQTPKIYGVTGSEQDAVLIMEFLETKQPDDQDWKKLARMVVALHKSSSDLYGLDYDNYIGDFPQNNTKYRTNWNQFFINNRVKPMLDRVISLALITDNEVNTIQQVVDNIDSITEKVDSDISLLHGDFWNGNILITHQGPMLIDPASYYGNREMDLAFNKMSPHLTFSDVFYKEYQKLYPLNSGYEDRENLWQVWPLLTHVVQDGRKYIPILLDKISKYL